MSYSPNDIIYQTNWDEIKIIPYKQKIRACLLSGLITDGENENGFGRWRELTAHDAELTDLLYEAGYMAEEIVQHWLYR